MNASTPRSYKAGAADSENSGVGGAAASAAHGIARQITKAAGDSETNGGATQGVARQITKAAGDSESSGVGRAAAATTFATQGISRQITKASGDSESSGVATQGIARQMTKSAMSEESVIMPSKPVSSHASSTQAGVNGRPQMSRQTSKMAFSDDYSAEGGRFLGKAAAGPVATARPLLARSHSVINEEEDETDDPPSYRSSDPEKVPCIFIQLISSFIHVPMSTFITAAAKNHERNV